MGEYQFPRELRLLTPAHFGNVFQQAIPAVSPHITLLARHNALPAPRLGITIAKKKVKTAVQRNRLKRVIRESFRQHQHTLPHVDIIVIGKTGADKLTNAELFSMLDKLWKKLARKCNASS